MTHLPTTHGKKSSKNAEKIKRSKGSTLVGTLDSIMPYLQDSLLPKGIGLWFWIVICRTVLKRFPTYIKKRKKATILYMPADKTEKIPFSKECHPLCSTASMTF